MSNSEELGAKQMFEQSLVYLYNSYREEGVPSKEAKQKVAEHILEVQKKYEEKEMIPELKKGSISNPTVLIEDVLKTLNSYDGKQNFALFKSTITRKLFHLKKILGG